MVDRLEIPVYLLDGAQNLRDQIVSKFGSAMFQRGAILTQTYFRDSMLYPVVCAVSTMNDGPQPLNLAASAERICATISNEFGKYVDTIGVVMVKWRKSHRPVSYLVSHPFLASAEPREPQVSRVVFSPPTKLFTQVMYPTLNRLARSGTLPSTIKSQKTARELYFKTRLATARRSGPNDGLASSGKKPAIDVDSRVYTLASSRFVFLRDKQDTPFVGIETHPAVLRAIDGLLGVNISIGLMYNNATCYWSQKTQVNSLRALNRLVTDFVSTEATKNIPSNQRRLSMVSISANSAAVGKSPSNPPSVWADMDSEFIVWGFFGPGPDLQIANGKDLLELYSSFSHAPTNPLRSLPALLRPLVAQSAVPSVLHILSRVLSGDTRQAMTVEMRKTDSGTRHGVAIYATGSLTEPFGAKDGKFNGTVFDPSRVLQFQHLDSLLTWLTDQFNEYQADNQSCIVGCVAIDKASNSTDSTKIVDRVEWNIPKVLTFPQPAAQRSKVASVGGDKGDAAPNSRVNKKRTIEAILESPLDALVEPDLKRKKIAAVAVPKAITKYDVLSLDDLSVQNTKRSPAGSSKSTRQRQSRPKKSSGSAAVTALSAYPSSSSANRSAPLDVAYPKNATAPYTEGVSKAVYVRQPNGETTVETNPTLFRWYDFKSAAGVTVKTPGIHDLLWSGKYRSVTASEFSMVLRPEAVKKIVLCETTVRGYKANLIDPNTGWYIQPVGQNRAQKARYTDKLELIVATVVLPGNVTVLCEIQEIKNPDGTVASWNIGLVTGRNGIHRARGELWQVNKKMVTEYDIKTGGKDDLIFDAEVISLQLPTVWVDAHAHGSLEELITSGGFIRQCDYLALLLARLVAFHSGALNVYFDLVKTPSNSVPGYMLSEEISGLALFQLAVEPSLLTFDENSSSSEKWLLVSDETQPRTLLRPLANFADSQIEQDTWLLEFEIPHVDEEDILFKSPDPKFENAKTSIQQSLFYNSVNILNMIFDTSKEQPNVQWINESKFVEAVTELHGRIGRIRAGESGTTRCYLRRQLMVPSEPISISKNVSPDDGDDDEEQGLSQLVQADLERSQSIQLIADALAAPTTVSAATIAAVQPTAAAAVSSTPPAIPAPPVAAQGKSDGTVATEWTLREFQTWWDDVLTKTEVYQQNQGGFVANNAAETFRITNQTGVDSILTVDPTPGAQIRYENSTLVVNSDTSFGDLGSGLGHVVLQLAATKALRRCGGIEIQQELNDAAKNFLALLLNSGRPLPVHEILLADGSCTITPTRFDTDLVYRVLSDCDVFYMTNDKMQESRDSIWSNTVEGQIIRCMLSSWRSVKNRQGPSVRTQRWIVTTTNLLPFSTQAEEQNIAELLKLDYNITITLVGLGRNADVEWKRADKSPIRLHYYKLVDNDPLDAFPTKVSVFSMLDFIPSAWPGNTPDSDVVMWVRQNFEPRAEFVEPGSKFAKACAFRKNAKIAVYNGPEILARMLRLKFDRAPAVLISQPMQDLNDDGRYRNIRVWDDSKNGQLPVVDIEDAGACNRYLQETAQYVVIYDKDDVESVIRRICQAPVETSPYILSHPVPPAHRTFQVGAHIMATLEPLFMYSSMIEYSLRITEIAEPQVPEVEQEETMEPLANSDGQSLDQPADGNAVDPFVLKSNADDDEIEIFVDEEDEESDQNPVAAEMDTGDAMEVDAAPTAADSGLVPESVPQVNFAVPSALQIDTGPEITDFEFAASQSPMEFDMTLTEQPSVNRIVTALWGSIFAKEAARIYLQTSSWPRSKPVAADFLKQCYASGDLSAATLTTLKFSPATGQLINQFLQTCNQFSNLPAIANMPTTEFWMNVIDPDAQSAAALLPLGDALNAAVGAVMDYCDAVFSAPDLEPTNTRALFEYVSGRKGSMDLSDFGLRFVLTLGHMLFVRDKAFGPQGAFNLELAQIIDLGFGINNITVVDWAGLITGGDNFDDAVYIQKEKYLSDAVNRFKTLAKGNYTPVIQQGLVDAVVGYRVLTTFKQASLLCQNRMQTFSSAKMASNLAETFRLGADKDTNRLVIEHLVLLFYNLQQSPSVWFTQIKTQALKAKLDEVVSALQAPPSLNTALRRVCKVWLWVFKQHTSISL